MISEKKISQWLDRGLIKRQKKSFDQIRNLLSRALRDIKTAEQNLAIDEEAVYTFAYLSMLRAGRAIMLLSGYRPDDGGQHKTTVEFASLVLGEKYRTLTRRFDHMRRRRNLFTYDPVDNLTEKETLEALNTAKRFVQEIIQWIKEKDPQLELF
ncbi:MAG TPA: HEPN domain-containing protein [Desulfatiglandales bacterium]|nr:HEPN domain-containing protein [Desulfatiglandales bacterium]